MTAEYQQRYKTLNQHQRQAVDTIDGPLLVLAGPGTGKTELLSMRVATILKRTDTLPSSILCLTYTDSGAAAMRERLKAIIGKDAYKVAIHTFHSFGAEIIGQQAEYFYHGADFRAADDLTQYEILREIFSELDYTNPLAGMMGDEFTHLKDTRQVISELKRSGLTSDELRAVLSANDTVLDAIERDITDIFSSRVSKSTVHLLAPIAAKVAELSEPPLPPGLTPYSNVLALALAHAIDEAVATNSTKPITTWKNTWCEKNEQGNTVFKDRRRHDKLRAASHIYFEYVSRMQHAGLFDYDDMILMVIHALETRADLRANVQEKYLYFLVDEFQDTNLAQLRLLYGIVGEQPAQANVMVVGDDDQAIYSFQGADVSNIREFRRHFAEPPIIVLTDNYRSTKTILAHARQVITQGTERLEGVLEGLSKELTAHRDDAPDRVAIHEYSSLAAERQTVAQTIAEQIRGGVDPASITVLARRHHELIALLPYLHDQQIAVNYERRDDAISHDVIRLIEHLARIVDALHQNDHSEADALLPEILAHPAFDYAPSDIYQLSLAAWRNRQLWLETMQTRAVFQPFAEWLLVRAAAIHSEPFETQLDALLGVPSGSTDPGVFVSPLYAYFFADSQRSDDPLAYLDALEALRTIRDALREHFTTHVPSLQGFIDFLELHRELATPLTVVRQRSQALEGHINLMTVHKSKGLEFDHVYIIGAVDTMWGERVRGRNRLIGYPANLTLAPAGDTYDERLRLFYVAMTRARIGLSISYSTQSASNKAQLEASFLTPLDGLLQTNHSEDSVANLTHQAELDWRGHLTRSLDSDLKTLLAPLLETYKLSATHLGNFLDVTRGGPGYFLLSNLLRFPQSKSAHAQYGTAIHATLQRAHNAYRARGTKRPVEDVLGDFERTLRELQLSESDFEAFLGRGLDALSAFLTARYDSFSTSQQTELSFGNQTVVLGEARLTGALDLADIDRKAKTIIVTDYKTGKPSRDWKGKSDYERIKLHKYRQQLMFYELLVRNSRDYSSYQYSGGVLQFVEPTPGGEIVELEARFSEQELAEFSQLIQAVWQAIVTLELPDISDYSPDYTGILAFEQALVDKKP